MSVFKRTEGVNNNVYATEQGSRIYVRTLCW